MFVGVLGDMMFQVSDSKIFTPSQTQWSGSACWAVHQRHLQGALTEYVGVEPDRISFQIRLSIAFGVNPMNEIHRIWRYERDGIPIPLTIGEHGYGKYRWVIVSHETEIIATDWAGNVSDANVSLTLQEYLKE